MKKFSELPKEIQEKMLERQFEQTGKRDASVFDGGTGTGKIMGVLVGTKRKKGQVFGQMFY